MPSECLSFADTGYFSSFICKYLEEDNAISPYYNRFPKIENFRAQIEEKKANFHDEHRMVLQTVLNEQYQQITSTNLTKENIASVTDSNTFTITTGHQLNLFTGPLYFLYKIISTINLCKELKAAYPTQNFVPIYWMASEDHDFEEINYFNFKAHKIAWERDFGGAVGELSTAGLATVLQEFNELLGPGKNATYLSNLFEDAYLKHSNLAAATRFIANAIFGDYGLVIVDANQHALKQLFVPYIKRELVEKVTHSEVKATIASFPKEFPVQVNPREINLFYLDSGIRERIIAKDGIFYINETSLSFSRDELLKMVDTHPERFSPNALLRPFYQELILPNLCYIGGGGELAYWFELKSTFENFGVSFPILLVRNSAVLVNAKTTEKLAKLDTSILEVFQKQEALVVSKTKAWSAIAIDFSKQKEHLKQQFKALHELAQQTDASFEGAVNAQEHQQIKGLVRLEKRLLTAQKRVLHEKIQRLKALQDTLFPKQSLQERHANFSEFYLKYGATLIPYLMQELKPLQQDFLCISFD
jgi:bacillithiol biosynthesis cysteine-adding enzyme BshC